VSIVCNIVISVVYSTCQIHWSMPSATVSSASAIFACMSRKIQYTSPFTLPQKITRC